ncbi:hypothetical protein BDW59DRAFT_149072 [Aspergillus cavernicola]|uniref:Alcohol acetyltransferase n=1 Tax=Aspergillus cavernicola TaxID=176166 RepID=A0ABR4I7F2_9EURO
MFMRYASPNERRTISREDLGYYNALVIGAIYEVEDIDITSPQSFIAPLKTCILEYPFLSVVVKDAHTEKPAYEGVLTVNLEDHISIIPDSSDHGNEAAVLEQVLPPILDRPWPAEIPPWRIVVLPLPSQKDTSSSATRCFIAFAFSHTLGDGMVGLAFHRTFLNTWRTPTTPDNSFSITPPTTRTLPPPFDTPTRLPISWKFLLSPLISVYLPKFLANLLGLRVGASTVDAGTWTGSPIFYNQPTPSTQVSKVRLIEIPSPQVQTALQASRSHDAKLTSTLHQLIIRALSIAVPNSDVTNFVSGTAVDMRASIGTPGYTWGLFVSGHYDVHPRIDVDVTESASSVLTEDNWISARSITRSLAECGARLHDQAIGLLRYAPSIRNWTSSKIGTRRDCSYEVSNLLAFDGGHEMDGGSGCKIEKMVFVQPGNVLSAPVVFNVVSVRGGELVIAVSWQVGALGVEGGVIEEERVVERICELVKKGVEDL